MEHAGLDYRTALTELKPHDHLCLIYEDEEQWRSAIVPFIATGLRQGEKCAYVADAHTVEHVSSLLAADGVDVRAAVGDGRLVFLRDADAYTRGGRFAPAQMIDMLRAETLSARAQGYQALRVTGEMTWALRGCPGSEELIEYEALLNRDLFPGYDCLAICQYDRRRFDAETLKGVILTHPWLAYGDRLLRNFYYVPPAEFLGEERSQREVDRWLSNLVREHDTTERYRSLYEGTTEGIALHELVHSTGGDAVDYQLVDVNAAFERITGIGRERAVGALASELFGTGQPPFLDVYADVAQTGTPARFETTFEPMGKSFSISVFSPTPGRFATVFDDITQRLRLEEHLRRWGQELEERVAERTQELQRTAAELGHSWEQARRLAQHLQSVREEERTAVAREVHDELGQMLTGLKMDLVWALARLDKPEGARQASTVARRMEAMLELVDTTIQRVRRISAELRPAVLDALGLVAAVEWQTREFEGRSGVSCVFRTNREDLPLGRACATALFRVLQEALTNIARHAGATRVRVSLAAATGGLRLRVADNGKGIEPDALSADTSLGLLGMRERMLVFGGYLQIKGAPGKGTTVIATLPCPCSAHDPECPDVCGHSR